MDGTATHLVVRGPPPDSQARNASSFSGSFALSAPPPQLRYLPVSCETLFRPTLRPLLPRPSGAFVPELGADAVPFLSFTPPHPPLVFNNCLLSDRKLSRFLPSFCVETALWPFSSGECFFLLLLRTLAHLFCQYAVPPSGQNVFLFRHANSDPFRVRFEGRSFSLPIDPFWPPTTLPRCSTRRFMTKAGDQRPLQF